MLVTLATLYASLLLWAAWSDVRSRRVPNIISVSILAVSITAELFHAATVSSVVQALTAVLVGLACWFPFWHFGVLGAGDVKLFAAASAWIGVDLTWRAALLAALLGGLFSLLMVVHRNGLSKGLYGAVAIMRHRVLPSEEPARYVNRNTPTIAYAVPMAVSLSIAAFLPHGLYLIFPP